MTLALGATQRPTASKAAPFRVGGAGARLLSGPREEDGGEPLAGHLDRLGPLPSVEVDQLFEELEASQLAGRGGGGFPAARKLGTARAAARGRAPKLVVNASESEPASLKDKTLCTLRPHLVLDGAAVAAAIVGAPSVVIYVHRGADAVADAFRWAVAERREERLSDPAFHLGIGPARYVAGEASAAASWLEGGEAKPRSLGAPLAVRGVAGQPTVVHNPETLAHLALLVRFGANWWAEAGTEISPGSRLVTVHAGDRAATLLEVVEPVTVGTLIESGGPARATDPFASRRAVPRAVLVGGYAGRFIDGAVGVGLPFTPEGLSVAGASPGCGLVAPLPERTCGVAAAAHLARWLAGESAGQCGPCLYGLADVAEALASLVAGTSSRREVRRLRRLLDDIGGKGACHHPDGVVAMVRSALDVFGEELNAHARRRECPGGCAVPRWPLPSSEEVWR